MGTLGWETKEAILELAFEGRHVAYQMDKRKKAVCYHQVLFWDWQEELPV